MSDQKKIEPTTTRYTRRRAADDVLRDVRQEIKDSAQSSDPDAMLAALLQDEESGLMPLIRELAQLAEPQVTIPLSMAEHLAGLLGAMGDGDGDIRHLVELSVIAKFEGGQITKIEGRRTS
jgi:hypothetical protein